MVYNIEFLRIFVKRKYFNEFCIIGDVRVDDDKGNTLFTCNSLENPKIGAERNQDLAIPAGTYRCSFHKESRFTKPLQKMLNNPNVAPLCLFNEIVPESRRILIHWGNFEKDTEGCILLGERSADNKSVLNSKKICTTFYKLVSQFEASDILVAIE